ncbi:MAG: pantoate--beta-alanine ligase [Planctomycetota bacterium]|jgi:pantoate--beta-alanine ligase
MDRFDEPAPASVWCSERQSTGRSIGFVPTMGALHEGHLSLVRRAARENDDCVVSVFVNPLQFDDPSDFERYPRDLDRDAELLAGAGCSMVFTGSLQGFFPGVTSLDEVALEDPGPAAVGLEGEHRCGHFEGVATIVRRLFELVRPTRAYFGEKDFQQTLVVRDLARRLGMPEVVVHPTSREESGLARSSRNVRLRDGDRQAALQLWRALDSARAAWSAGERSAVGLRSVLAQVLEHDGVEVEYADVRDPENFADVPADGDRLTRAQALVAARVGDVRLIDNLRLDREVKA